MDTRPPPPPHGSNTAGGPNASSSSTNGAYSKSSHLPPGNYDIFVIPPHSAGSGFLYLPSMQPHRNSFLAGVACTLTVVAIWAAVIPAIKHWLSSVAASGGMAVMFLVLAVGVLGWAAGKTQSENAGAGSGGTNGSGGHHQPNANPYGFSAGGSMPFGTNGGGGGAGAGGGSKPFWQRPPPQTGAGASSWEKAREETRKREEQRRKQEDVEKDRARAREKEAREKAAREKIAQERQRKENEAKNTTTKEKDSTKPTPTPAPNSSKTYQKPTAQSYVDDDEDDGQDPGAYSYRPYDNPKKHKQNNSNSSYVSASTWAPSKSTAKTSPPPSRRGPYTNKDPEKISIKAVYAFHDQLVKPVAQLVSGTGSVTDGLILKISTEGLFIDDDVRGVGQREWDVKAWSIKLIETGDLKGKHVLRATTRDGPDKKYVFVIDAAESWKVAMGLQRLRRGAQVRSLGVSGLPTSEARALLISLGWLKE